MDLVALGYSPWSEKARWALDHHGIAYAYSEYLPMLGELPLRIRAGKMRGKITVPILFDGDLVVDDSFAIARHAEALGEKGKAGAPLFAPGDAVAAWNATSDELLAAGRALVLRNIGADGEAQREALPSFVPDALRAASASMAVMATRFLAKKHGTRDADPEACIARMDATLAKLRKALGGRAYLCGAFSYADVAMAAAMQMVAPVDDAYIPLGEATRRCWTVQPLATKYAELVAWRDALYAKHRRARA